MKKKFIRLFLFGSALILAVYIGLFLYYYFACSSHYSKQQVDSLITNINSAPKLNERFYTIYDKVYKDRHESITMRYLKGFWTDLLMLKYPLKNNWQLQAAYLEPYEGYRWHIAPFTLAFRISRNVSSEQCFDYIMAYRYSEYCKEFKIADTITSLLDTEQIIKFIIANKQPRYYRTHPTTFKAETDNMINEFGLR